MIRGKYLREMKAIRFKRRMKLLICMLILLILHKIIFSSFSLYESEANSELDVDVAFFVLENENLGHLIKLDELEPGGETIFKFSIANFYNEEYVDPVDGATKERTVLAETDIKYNLKIRTTTNLPLEYELYVNDDPYENPTAVEQINGRSQINQDEYDTYFNKLIEYENTFRHDLTTTDTYILKVKLPNDNVDYTYQNTIDAIEITVNAEQVI